MKQLKLQINLVPQSSWTDNVRAVVSKKQWDSIRKFVYAKANFVCEICGGIGPKHPVEAHEEWLYDDINQTQTLEKIVSLCPACHRCKHFGFARVQGKEEIALKHFMKVNKLKRSEAEKYIQEAFDTWAKRSLKAWTLDLSLLKQYGIDLRNE